MRRNSGLFVLGLILVTCIGFMPAAPARAAPVFTDHFRGLLSTGPNVEYALDVNGDGVNDLRFVHSNEFATGLPLGRGVNTVTALNGAQVAVDGTRADAFTPGELIGPGRTWATGALIFDGSAGGDPALTIPDSSLGVRFVANGQTHYGWVGVQYVPGVPFPVSQLSSLAVGDYAWESTPNTAIAAGVPEPAGLALVAAVAAVMVTRMRRS